MLAKDLLFEKWDSRKTDSELCKLKFTPGTFFGRTFYCGKDILPILNIFDEAISSKENSIIFINKDTLSISWELITHYSTPRIISKYWIITLKHIYDSTAIIDFTFDKLHHLVNLSITPSLGNDPFISIFFEKFKLSQLECLDRHIHLVGGLLPLFEKEIAIFNGNNLKFPSLPKESIPQADYTKVIAATIISKTITYYNNKNGTEEWSNMLLSESFMKKVICLRLQLPPEMAMIPSKPRMMKRNAICYKGQDLHLMACQVLGLDSVKFTSLIAQEPWQIETLTGALHLRLRQYLLGPLYNSDETTEISTYKISLITNGSREPKDALDELLLNLLEYEFKLKNGIHVIDLNTLAEEFENVKSMIKLIGQIHSGIQESNYSTGFEAQIQTLEEAKKAVIENTPVEYSDDKLFLALVDDFFSHTISSSKLTCDTDLQSILKESKIELVRELASKFPNRYCKTNIVIDIYNRIRRLYGVGFLLTSDDQFPVQEFNEAQVHEMRVIDPDDFSVRYYVLMGLALSEVSLDKYKRYIKKFNTLSSLEQTLNMFRLFGLDYSLERQGVTVKRHHLARLDAKLAQLYKDVPYFVLIQRKWRVVRHVVFLKLLKCGVVRVQSLIRRQLFRKSTAKAKEMANDFVGLVITLVAIRNGFIPSKPTLQTVRKMEKRFQTLELELLRIAAATFIQSHWRVYKARLHRRKLEVDKIVEFSRALIIGFVKSLLARDSLIRQKKSSEALYASNFIKAVYKGYLARKQYRILHGLAIAIPSIIAKASRLQGLSVRLSKTRNKEMRELISLEMQLPPYFTKVQNLFRMRYVRKQYKTLRLHLQIAQSFAMTKMARLEFERLYRSVIKIQRFFKSKHLIKRLGVPTIATSNRAIDVDERSAFGISLYTFRIVYYRSNSLSSWYSGGWGVSLFQILYYIDKIKVSDKLRGSLALGRGHSLILLKFGDSTLLFSWGCNDRGQLGRPGLDTPQFGFKNLLQPLFRVSVKSVYAGDEFSCCLDDAGALYTWGDNRLGQCGHGHRLVTIPTPTYLIEGIDKLIVGSNHCYARSNFVDFVWGSGNHLGFDSKNWYVPTKVYDYLGGSVDLISLGEGENGATLYTTPDRLYIWASSKDIIESFEFGHDTTIKKICISRNLKCILLERNVPLKQTERRSEFVPKTVPEFTEEQMKPATLTRSVTFGVDPDEPLDYQHLEYGIVEVWLMGMLRTDREARVDEYRTGKDRKVKRSVYTHTHYSVPIKLELGAMRVTDLFADKYMIVVSCDNGRKVYAADCFSECNGVLIPSLYQFVELRDSGNERRFDLSTNYLGATVVYTSD